MSKSHDDTFARFSFDSWAPPAHTVTRSESGDLLTLVQGEHRVYVDGPRRTGKTTLVINTLEGAGIPVLRLDLDGVSSVPKLVERVSNDAIGFLEQHPEVKKRLLGSGRVKAGVSGAVFGFLNASLEGEKGIEGRKLDLNLDTMLSVIEEVAKAAKAVVFVDEFQTVKSQTLESPAEVMGSFAAASDPARTRGKVSYVFAGSNRHAMHQIFSGAESLFFQRTRHLPLGPIPEHVIMPFLEQRLGRALPQAIAHEAYTWTEGIPGDLQRLFSAMRTLTADARVVTPQDLIAAKRSVVEGLGRSYAATLKTVGSTQVQLLDLMARHNIRSLDDLANAAASSDVDIDRINESLEGLLRLGLIHVPPAKTAIERPEPIFFHYLLAHPAIEHRPNNRLLTPPNAKVDDVIGRLEKALLKEQAKRSPVRS